MSIYSGPNPNLRNIPNGVPNLAVPEGSPSLYIDFVNNQYETVNNGIKTASSNAMSLITFTRSSNATYTAANGTIQYVANNVPRFDYDSTTGYCKGLLIEEQRTNLLTNSVYPLSANTSPTSTLYGINLYPVTSDSSTQVYYTWNGVGGNSAFFTVNSGSTYTVSLYCKPGTATSFLVSLVNNVGTNISGGQTSISLPTNGGRITCTMTASASSTSAQVQILSTIGTTAQIGGIQVEQGSFATSYIPTVGSTATRIQDYSYIGNQIINPNNGSIHVKFSQLQNVYPSYILGSAGGPWYSMLRGENSTTWGFSDSVGDKYLLSFTPAPIYQAALSWSNSTLSVNLNVNGSTATSAFSGSFSNSTTNNLYLMCFGNPVNPVGSGWLKTIAYYSQVLSNTSLQQITT